MSRGIHWEAVYANKAPHTVSWYQPRAARSMEFIGEAGVGTASRLLDVGGGASVLVENLLDAGYADVTVLDIAGSALAAARLRLGERAGDVTWLEADITDVELPTAGFDLWHDRAVFHFLIDPADRSAYVRTLHRALRPGGHAIIATFAEDGPERCSGLPVQRYSPEQLREQLGEAFTLLAYERDEHVTPAGALQRFQYSLFRRLPA